MWSIQEKTGWTDEYLLWGVSLANIRMKLADSVKYRKGSRPVEVENWDEILITAI